MSDGGNERLRELLLEWRRAPTKFVMDVLGVKPDYWQAEALTHLADRPETFELYVENLLLEDFPQSTEQYETVLNNYENGVFGHVSVRSGHGVGKSSVMSWAGLWFLTCFYPCKIPATAPTKHQLEDVLFAEIDKWYRKMPEALRNQFEVGKESIYLKSAPKQSFLVARTARREQPEALQGFHAENIAFLIDEASGIDDIIFELAEGALTTPSARALMCANPTRTQGYFYDSHTRTSKLWHTMRVSCLDSPLVSGDYIESQKLRYGEDSNVYRVRVLGEFPTADDDAVVPLHLVHDAVARDIKATKDDPVVWGVDVARFGDDRTTLCKRRKNVVLEKVKWWRNKDTMQTSGLITREYQDTPEDERPDEIIVDVIGIGSGVVDRLRENGLPVRGVNVAEMPSQDGKYFRLRDELWWRAREFFEDRIASIPDDGDLIDEMVQPRYEVLSSGKIRVESKEDVKKRVMNKQSPDLADSFVLTFASGLLRKRAAKELKYPELGII